MKRLLAVLRKPHIGSHDPFTKPIEEMDVGELVLSKVT